MPPVPGAPTQLRELRFLSSFAYKIAESIMSVTAPLVQQLHRINRQKTDLLGQLDRGPKTVAAATRRLQAAEQNVSDIRAKLTKMKVEADSKQLQMREREQKIVKWQGNLKRLQRQSRIPSTEGPDRRRRTSQPGSFRRNPGIAGIDRQRHAIAGGSGTKRETTARGAGQNRTAGVGQESCFGERAARVRTELAAAEKELTGDFKREYTRLVAAKGEDAMAELEGKCCGGCYQSLTPQLLDKLLQGQPMLCPSCGRLIYQDHDR